MAAAQYMRLLGNSAKPVTQVDVYDSSALANKFNQKETEFKAAGKPTTKVWVFHGTPATENVPKICTGGFRVGGQDGHPIVNGAVHGQGVYTAKGPQTPEGYAKDSKQVILCLALPGKPGAKGVDDS